MASKQTKLQAAEQRIGCMEKQRSEMIEALEQLEERNTELSRHCTQLETQHATSEAHLKAWKIRYDKLKERLSNAETVAEKKIVCWCATPPAEDSDEPHKSYCPMYKAEADGSESNISESKPSACGKGVNEEEGTWSAYCILVVGHEGFCSSVEQSASIPPSSPLHVIRARDSKGEKL